MFVHTWPNCLATCGIMVDGAVRGPPGATKVELAVAVQGMMARITIARCDADKGRDRLGDVRRYAQYEGWGWNPPGPLNAYDPLAKALVGHPLSRWWGGGTAKLLALADWMRALRWPATGRSAGITTAELALDFEVVTGLDLVDKTTPVIERAVAMGFLLRQVGVLANGREVMGGIPQRHCRALRVLGGPALAGFTARPVLPGGAETEEAIKSVLTMATSLTDTRRAARKRARRDEPTVVTRWADDTVPAYDRTAREGRARRWEAEAEAVRCRLEAQRERERAAELQLKQRARGPRTVDDGVQRKTGNRYTCKQHDRTRCLECDRPENKVPLEECCAEHRGQQRAAGGVLHGASDDGLRPVRVGRAVLGGVLPEVRAPRVRTT